MRIGLFSCWVNSYWGGALPACAGALVLGALPRILRNPQLRHGVALAGGASILAITRPYEGLLVCLPVAARLLLALRRAGPPRPPMLPRVFTPAATILAIVC